jgi:hypothetical protein
MNNLNLKVGDKVIAYGGFNQNDKVLIVDSITKGGNYKMNSGEIYNKDGNRRGNDGYYRRYFKGYSKDAHKKIKEDTFYRNSLCEINTILNRDSFRNVDKAVVEKFIKQLNS